MEWIIEALPARIKYGLLLLSALFLLATPASIIAADGDYAPSIDDGAIFPIDVSLNGKSLEPNIHYDSEQLLIYDSFLETLPDGEYVLTIVFSSGAPEMRYFIINRSAMGNDWIRYIDEGEPLSFGNQAEANTSSALKSETHDLVTEETDTALAQSDGNGEFWGVPYADTGLENSAYVSSELNAVADKTPSFGVVPQTGVPSVTDTIVGVSISLLLALALSAYALRLAKKRK